MPPITYIDIVDGTSGKLTRMGWEMRRKAVVTGVEGDGHARMLDATLVEGFPEINDPHPADNSILLREIIPVKLVSTDAIEFMLVYKESDPWTWSYEKPSIEIGATVSQIQTNKDYAGAVITVGWTPPSGYNENVAAKPKEGVLHETSDTISILVPDHSITISKKEKASPQSKAKLYVGWANSGGWTWDKTAAPRTWLCTGIVGRSDDGGKNYQVTYDFQYRADTWDSVVLYIDPNTGQPPADLIGGTGIKTIQMYGTKNFSTLKL